MLCARCGEDVVPEMIEKGFLKNLCKCSHCGYVQNQDTWFGTGLFMLVFGTLAWNAENQDIVSQGNSDIAFIVLCLVILVLVE